MSDRISFKVYKVSINILWHRYYFDSKVYEINEGKSKLLPGLKYSLLTLLLGWWSHPFKSIPNSLKALDINFRGGQDYTKYFTEVQYEKRVVYIYSNLYGSTKNKITIDDLNILVVLQDEYTKIDNQLETNSDYLLNNLKKINITNFTLEDIDDFITTYSKANTKHIDI